MMPSPPSSPRPLRAVLVFGAFLLVGRAAAFSSSRPPTFLAAGAVRLDASTSTKNVNHPRRCNTHGRIKGAAATALSSSSDDFMEASGEGYRDADVAGVSVSPLGFLVLLQSTKNTGDQDERVAFPISLTSPPESISSTYTNDNSKDANSSSISSNITIPELFRENTDQTSVTSPEALTFLQLLNGVDMATPILPPDTLSLICVWYAFLLEEWESSGRGGDVLVVEDELGLSSTEDDNIGAGDGADSTGTSGDKFRGALDYIRAMVRTTLPPSSDGSYFLNYVDASPWQRARIQLPRAWLHGVRLQELELTTESSAKKDNSKDESSCIGRIPVQYILECSVDDGSKMLEIPLLAIPSSAQQAQEDLNPIMQQQLDISNDVLQELSQNYNPETSAAFMSLALFHRYNRSGAGSAGSPILKVSDGLLQQLQKLQQREEGARYCWTVSTGDDNGVDNNIDAAIQSKGLPLYRPLSQIQEEDQRVLQHLEQQNFGKNPNAPVGDGGADGKADDGNGGNGQQQQQRKKALTLEQQATQQRLKSAWKVAMQREDAGALEKIQKAMEDLEKEVMNNPDEEEEESALQKIQRAMEQSGGDDVDDNNRQRRARGEDGEGEEVVGLISDLEEAAISSMAVEESVDSDEEER